MMRAHAASPTKRVPQVRFVKLGLGFSCNHKLLTTDSRPHSLSAVDWRLSASSEVQR
jgi:hypothetical protein